MELLSSVSYFNYSFHKFSGVLLSELTYDDLRRLQRKEMSSASLVHLPEEFYSNAVKLTDRLQRELKNDFSLSSAREYENTLKIIRDIYSKREGKILRRAMRVARTGEEIEGLTSEEKTLLSSVVKLLDKNREIIENRFSEEKVQPESHDDKLKLKFITDFPAFVGMDGNTYGPFKTGTEGLFANEEAQRLLRRGAVEEI